MKNEEVLNEWAKEHLHKSNVFDRVRLFQEKYKELKYKLDEEDEHLLDEFVLATSYLSSDGLAIISNSKK